MYVAEAKTNYLVTGGVVSSGSNVSKSKYILLDSVVCSRDRRKKNYPTMRHSKLYNN